MPTHVRFQRTYHMRAALRAFACLIAFAGGFISLPPARAERPSNLGGESLPSALSQAGDLSLRNTSLPDALLTISELWGVNIVIGQEVDGSVNGVFTDAPLKEILDAILLSNGYSYRPLGNSLVVKRLEDFGDMNPLFETATISLGRLKGAEAVDSAKMLVSPRGKVLALESARSLLVVDFPERIAMVRQLVERLDATSPGEAVPTIGPRQVKAGYFETQFIPIASAKEAVSTILSIEGKSAILPDEDRLVVVDYPEVLAAVEQMLVQVDQPRKMIRITSFIYDVSIEDMQTLGVNWSSAVKGAPDAAGSTAEWAIDTITKVPFAAGTAGGIMTFANMSENFDLNATINALNTFSDSKLLADPNVVVLENEPAVVSIIQEIPFQQLTQTGQGGNIGTTAFREAGVKLSVKGRVAGHETIWMEVNPEFSRLTGFTPENNQPIIDRRTAETVVRIVNGRTLVIGGLRQRTDVNVNSGIPYLMDLPLGVGHLFRNRETTVRESELLVFIKPEIVAYDQPRNCREDAALQSTHQLLDGIPPAACQGCQPQYQEYFEAVPPLEEQYEMVPATKPEGSDPVREATALRTSVRLSEDSPNQIMRIPSVVPWSDRLPSVDSDSEGVPHGNRQLPTSFLPTRLPPDASNVMSLSPVSQDGIEAAIDDAVATKRIEAAEAAPLSRQETAVRPSPKNTWVYKIFRL